jgi:glucokinase
MSGPSPTVAPAAEAPPHPWLLADIGGTNARFAWVERAGGAVEHAQTLAVAARQGPLAAAREYLAALSGTLGAHYRAPASAAWAVATAVVGDEVALTNAGWRFSRQALQQALGLHTFVLLNDFEALALSLPGLEAGQLRAVGASPMQAAVPGAVRAVIGPGTGLGVAGLAACPPRGGDGASDPHWLALPGEGGHVTLAAADDLEWALLGAVRRQHAHVSAERVLSGIGLPDLHRAVVEVRLGAAATTAPMRTEDIVAAGTARAGETGADPLCRETLEHFCALLGGFAGNVALTLGARGGLYLGGGLLPRFGELFLRSRFRVRFEAKGRFDAYLRTIPTWLITDTRVALAGAAAALQQRRRA